MSLAHLLRDRAPRLLARFCHFERFLFGGNRSPYFHEMGMSTSTHRRFPCVLNLPHSRFGFLPAPASRAASPTMRARPENWWPNQSSRRSSTIGRGVARAAGRTSTPPCTTPAGEPRRHQVERSEEERGEQEQIARAEKLSWREVQRAKIVLYAASGQLPERLKASRLAPSGCKAAYEAAIGSGSPSLVMSAAS